MKTLITLLATTFISFTTVADDLADTKNAFATLIDYQKTDDERTPELFSKDCKVTWVISDGTNATATVIPIDAFIDRLNEEIAKKKGMTQTYEDIDYSQEASGVLVTANVRYPKSGRKGPFSALYRRGADGVLRIHDFKVTVYSNE